ncbi:MAG TPA: hypothetical protein VFD16_02040 [Candidatus Saccharimonadales bacterium]|nr:hypothetical protein [Candidatus Saccharimonadales bacterium]
MKKDRLFLLAALFVMACLCFFYQKTLDSTGAVSVPDSITVYGNIHLPPTGLESLGDEDELAAQVIAVQQWLYQAIDEPIVLMEGVPFKGTPYSRADLYRIGGAVYDFQKERINNYANLYDVGLRFILEGKKQVFGGEDSLLFQAVYDSLQANINFAQSPGFQELNNLRSAKIAENTEHIYAIYHRRVAIIVGQIHLAWFQDHGYLVKYPPEY